VNQIENNRVRAAAQMNERGFRMRRATQVAVALVATLIGMNDGMAGTITATFSSRETGIHNHSGLNGGLVKTVDGAGSPTGSAPATAPLGQGGFDFTVNHRTSPLVPGPGGSASSASILGFCLEMTQAMPGGPNPNFFSLTGGRSFPGDPNGNSLGGTPAMPTDEMWSKYMNTILNPTAGLTASQAACAFQLAIWNLEDHGHDPFGMPGALDFSKSFVAANPISAGDATMLNMTTAWNGSLSLKPPTGELAQLAAVGASTSHDHFSQPTPPQEPTGHLLWLLVGAIAVYPVMRLRPKNAG
jgi:hypothetical protein